MALIESTMRNRLSGTMLDSYISMHFVIPAQKKLTVGSKAKIHISKPPGF